MAPGRPGPGFRASFFELMPAGETEDLPILASEPSQMENKEESQESLIVASKAKNIIKNHGCMVAGDALDELNRKVHRLIEDAVKRTKENKRSTVRPHDF
jgi:histone H3/H4